MSLSAPIFSWFMFIARYVNIVRLILLLFENRCRDAITSRPTSGEMSSCFPASCKERREREKRQKKSKTKEQKKSKKKSKKRAATDGESQGWTCQVSVWRRKFMMFTV